MSRLDTFSRFEEPDFHSAEAYECKKCGEIKDAKEFRDDHSEMCLKCEEESELLA